MNSFIASLIMGESINNHKAKFNPYLNECHGFSHSCLTKAKI